MPKKKETEEVEVNDIEEVEEHEETIEEDTEEEELEEVEEEVLPGMATVMDRDTGELVTIDTKKEKNWKKRYLHRSGNEFDHQY